MCFRLFTFMGRWRLNPPLAGSDLSPLIVSGLPPFTVSGLPPFALVLVANGLPIFFVLVCSTVYVCEVAMLNLLFKGFWRFGGGKVR